MFLKSLIISQGKNIIREINFQKGINLIVDEREVSEMDITKSGNGVGKTTVLKLIDFCLGASPKSIYTNGNTKEEYKIVKEFLVKRKILITLTLVDDLDIEQPNKVVIKRNFLPKNTNEINEISHTDKDFLNKLTQTFFPTHKEKKPSFRQIISHNIRYDDNKVSNTLETLDTHVNSNEYEILHLFMLGCNVKQGDGKQEIARKIKQEEEFKKRLEKDDTKNRLETRLKLIQDKINNLIKDKEKLKINPNYKEDLDSLTSTQQEINKIVSEINKLKIRENIILEAKNDLEKSKSDIDVRQLQIIYEQASSQMGKIHKTFEDLVSYHNNMITEKVKFILQELPLLKKNIFTQEKELEKLLQTEKKLKEKIFKGNTFEDLEKINMELQSSSIQKGELQKLVEQLNKVYDSLKSLHEKRDLINKDLFSEEFKKNMQSQIDKFNQYFSRISKELYDEQYALTFEEKSNTNGEKIYKFSTFNADNPNLSSGKKQGEISCFEIAYILFADSEKMPLLHFVLNDKRELLHDNQLINITKLVNQNNMQFIISILKDKLPEELNKEEYFVIKLSQSDKLFKI